MRLTVIARPCRCPKGEGDGVQGQGHTMARLKGAACESEGGQGRERAGEGE